MRGAILAVAGLVFGVGCAAGSDVGEVGAVVLSPTPEARADVEAAAARWSAATGIAIVVAPGGLPIELRDGVSAPAGYGVCAITESDGNGPKSMRVDSDPPAGACNTRANVVAHEVGHVICRTFTPHASADACHSDTGLMRHAVADLARDSVINEASLAAVCANAPCSVFAPEL